jgi:hypothetical protein
MPALITSDDRLFSIAQLIASGTVSFFSDGARPTNTIDMARLFQFKFCAFKIFFSHQAVSFHRLFALILVAGPTIPKFDETEGSFKSGFRTYYDSFSTSDTDDSADDNDSYRSKIQSSEETDNKESYRREEKSYKTKKRTTKHSTTGEQIQRESRERKLFGLFSFYIHRSEIEMKKIHFRKEPCDINRYIHSCI